MRKGSGITYTEEMIDSEIAKAQAILAQDPPLGWEQWLANNEAAYRNKFKEFLEQYSTAKLREPERLSSIREDVIQVEGAEADFELNMLMNQLVHCVNKRQQIEEKDIQLVQENLAGGDPNIWFDQRNINLVFEEGRSEAQNQNNEIAQQAQNSGKEGAKVEGEIEQKDKDAENKIEDEGTDVKRAEERD